MSEAEGCSYVIAVCLLLLLLLQGQWMGPAEVAQV
jgi:hypothetical protein